MVVALTQTCTVTEHFQLARFGEVSLSSGGRLTQPTNVVAPGDRRHGAAGLNDRNRIMIDDGNNQQNTDPIVFGRGGSRSAPSNTLRGGDTVTARRRHDLHVGRQPASGNAYRVRPLGALDGAPSLPPTNPRPATPAEVGGDLRVAA